MKGFLLISLASAAFSVHAQEEPNRLVDIGVALTLEGVSNLHGGIDERTRTLENLDITFEIDTENASLWAGGTFFVYFLGNLGSDPSEFVGDAQTSSNIEAYDTFKLYEAWYEQSVGDFGLLAGLHDLNSEFYALDSAGLFMGSSFGVGPELSQNGPSIFSTTSLAVRGRWDHANGTFVRAAVYDGIPGDPENEQGTQVIVKGEDGLFYIAELGRGTDDYKVALGSWYHTTDFVDYTGTERSHNSGLYLIGQHNLGTDFNFFLQLGKTQSDRNEIDTYVGSGITTAALLSERDEAGLAVAHARVSEDVQMLNSLEEAETAIELTYGYTFTDYLRMQTSLHHIINPSMDSTVDDATVLAVRATVEW